MISDEDVKQLFQESMDILARHWIPNRPLHTEFYRGLRVHKWEHQHPGGCDRHLSVFDKYNVIPRYCFDCYKVLIEPRTVVELFKLMMIFDTVGLPNDNARKCIVECREEISGTYKGLIYCRGIDEGKEICKIAREVVSEEISSGIPVTLKRGCSEYALAYPEFAQLGQDTTAMEYNEEWQKIEALADRELSYNTQIPVSDTHNSPAYTLQDARAMLAWLKYAAMIGDSSYLKISGRPVHPVTNVKRPPIQPAED